MFGFTGLAPFVFVLSLVFGKRLRREPKKLTLHELNKECGVHNFDLNGVKVSRDTNKMAIVIDDTTETDEDSALINFRGCGPFIHSRLNSSLANYPGNFPVYRKIEKGRYVRHGTGRRSGNYWARIRDGKIYYLFPIEISIIDPYTPILFWWR
jgi:hypothetical protein